MGFQGKNWHGGGGGAHKSQIHVNVIPYGDFSRSNF